MFCYTCGWFYNPNQKCGCYRRKDGSVIRKNGSESLTEYRKRIQIIKQEEKLRC